MKTYWDYDENERANLTDDQVRELLKYEAMREGIAVPNDPGPAPEIAEPDVEMVTIHGVKAKSNGYSSDTIWFSTLEEAQTVIALKPFGINHDYKIGQKYSYPDGSDVEIVTKQVVASEDALRDAAAELVSAKSRRDGHGKLVDAYKQAREEARDVYAKVWDDWHEQRAEVANAKHIAETHQRYVADCDGNETIAARFLYKAFEVSDVVAAFTRLGVEPPAKPVEATERDLATA